MLWWWGVTVPRDGSGLILFQYSCPSFGAEPLPLRLVMEIQNEKGDVISSVSPAGSASKSAKANSTQGRGNPLGRDR
jgi:hypothetical protein